MGYLQNQTVQLNTGRCNGVGKLTGDHGALRVHFADIFIRSLDRSLATAAVELATLL